MDYYLTTVIPRFLFFVKTFLKKDIFLRRWRRAKSQFLVHPLVQILTSATLHKLGLPLVIIYHTCKTRSSFFAFVGIFLVIIGKFFQKKWIFLIFLLSLWEITMKNTNVSRYDSKISRNLPVKGPGASKFPLNLARKKSADAMQNERPAATLLRSSRRYLRRVPAVRRYRRSVGHRLYAGSMPLQDFENEEPPRKARY
jgi:hypothetical protein